MGLKKFALNTLNTCSNVIDSPVIEIMTSRNAPDTPVNKKKRSSFGIIVNAIGNIFGINTTNNPEDEGENIAPSNTDDDAEISRGEKLMNSIQELKSPDPSIREVAQVESIGTSNTIFVFILLFSFMYTFISIC